VNVTHATSFAALLLYLCWNKNISFFHKTRAWHISIGVARSFLQHILRLWSEVCSQYMSRHVLWDLFLVCKQNCNFVIKVLAPSFTFNSNKSPTWCNSYSVYYPDVCLQLNMFRVFSRPSSGAQWCSGSLWFYLRIVVIVVLCSWLGRPTQPRTQHDYRHDTKVKPEAATAVNDGGKTPETCWAVNKRQDNKLKNCCIRLVIYLNCTMMHGLTYLKHYI